MEGRKYKGVGMKEKGVELRWREKRKESSKMQGRSEVKGGREWVR